MSEFFEKKLGERRGRYLATLLLIIGAALFAFSFDVGNLAIFLQKHEKVGIFLCLLVYLLLGLTFIPSEPVTLLVLAWEGPILAILLATLGNTLAAIVEYFLGDGIKDLTDFEKKKEKLPFHLGQLPINSPVFLLFARMLPGYGSKFVSIAGGVYHVPMITFVWTAVVSNLVGAALIPAALIAYSLSIQVAGAAYLRRAEPKQDYLPSKRYLTRKNYRRELDRKTSRRYRLL